jgi:RHS repeat-associated protein
VIKETNATTGNVTDYLYGDDLIKQTQAANDSYYLYDGLGSTRALSDSTGTVTDSYNYESFGSVLNQTGSTENDYLFTGEQYDSGLDNYYLRARYYDQNVGRFTQMDTWMGNNSDPVTLHKYLYANANPVNYTDPTGNFSLVSFEAANTIRGILAETTVQVGFSILDSAFSDGGEASGPNFVGAGIAAIGGPASFKLLKMLSGKFRKACNSFDADTEVWTEEGIKHILGLEIGDKVWAYNEETGELELQDIVHLIQREGDYQLIELSVGDETIKTTANHPFYVKAIESWEWKNASELKAGDIVKDQQGNGLAVVAINTKLHNGKVFNLTVDNVHTYLVGKQGVVAHNAGSCDKMRDKIIGKLLMPTGKPIGKPGTSPNIRELTGGKAKAERLFNQLAKDGVEVQSSGYPGKLVKLPGGSTVGLRTVMTKSPKTEATIDVNIPDVPITKLKFNP